MKRFYPILLTAGLFMLLCSTALAQLEMNSTTGHLGIGVLPASTHKLRLFYDLVDGQNNHVGIYSYSAGASNVNYGLYGLGEGDSGTLSVHARGVYGLGRNASLTNIGVQAVGEAGAHAYGANVVGRSGTDANYGVHGRGEGGLVAYGVYGTTSGGATQYAGYFAGDLVYTGILAQVSDARLKEAVEPLSGSEMLEKVLLLRPTRYRFKQDASLAGMHLAEGVQYGLIAQEVGVVFPELVRELVHPGEVDAEGVEVTAGQTVQGLRTDQLMAVLVSALQAQQGQIAAQQSQIEALVAALEANGIRVGEGQ